MTSSLRSLIEAKSRRTATFPLAVGNVVVAAAEVSRAQAALDEHLSHEREPAESTEEALRFEERTSELREALATAEEAAASTVVLIEVQALPSDEWEELFGPLVPDESGEVPLDSCRAEMLAASCVDPDLQDAAWWREQLARPSWSKGDKVAADWLLVNLNNTSPSGRPGKG